MNSHNEIWMLSPSEFTTLFVLSSSSYGLNAFQVYRDIIYRNAALLYNLAHGFKTDKKNISTTASVLVFVHAQPGTIFSAAVSNLPTSTKADSEKIMQLFHKGDILSLRQCEKILRKYMDLPSYDKVMRMLQILKKEGFVVSRASGKGAVWAVSPEERKKIIDYALGLTLNESYVKKFFE